MLIIFAVSATVTYLSIQNVVNTGNHTASPSTINQLKHKTLENTDHVCNTFERQVSLLTDSVKFCIFLLSYQL